MAKVTVNTGPINADDLIRDVPREKWSSLLFARKASVHTRIPYDCRSLLRYVEEASEHRMWEVTGHQDLDDYIRNGLDIDPEMVKWARVGLSAMSGDEPITLAAAVEVGKRTAAQTMAEAPELMTPEEAGRKGGRGKAVTAVTPLRKGNNPDRLAARIKRDHPEIAARVEAGEFKSIRAAALEAGIVKPRFSIPVDSPDAAIRALLRIFTVEDLAAALGNAADQKH